MELLIFDGASSGAIFGGFYLTLCSKGRSHGKSPGRIFVANIVDTLFVCYYF